MAPRINNGAGAATVSNQATVLFDADGDSMPGDQYEGIATNDAAEADRSGGAAESW